MNKHQLIYKFARERNLPFKTAKTVVDAFFNEIALYLYKGDRVEIRGFGTFGVKRYGEYVGRNPKNGDPVNVKPKKMPYFKVGKDLKTRVNIGLIKK